ncbi:MAG: ribosome silencing factor [Planctomycetes bacterium]|nr:ribosome silencing factor [Planctomycetota bacterium]
MGDIAILDVAQTFQITDCFVLGTGLNQRHIRSTGDYLIRELRKDGVRRVGLEGYRDARWLLLDFSDVIVHLFLPGDRQHYDLELLWGDCARIEWSSADPAVASGG